MVEMVEEKSRARSWTFTVNNYEDEEVHNYTRTFDNLGKYIFQEEMGENKTPHLQGVITFKNAKTFSAVKKIIPRAHIEKCKSLVASRLYCQKEDTRIGEIYTNIVPTEAVLNCFQVNEYLRAQTEFDTRDLNLEFGMKGVP